MKYNVLVFSLLIVLCCQQQGNGQLMDKGVMVVGLTVNFNDFGQGAVFRRNSECIIITADHVVNGGFNIDVVSETNGSQSKAGNYRTFNKYDLSAVSWRADQYLERLKSWRVPKNYRRLIRGDRDYRLLYRDKDGTENAKPVTIVKARDTILFVEFNNGDLFEQGMSGGALVLRQKNKNDIYIGMMYEKSGDEKQGLVLPADLIDAGIKKHMAEVDRKRTRNVISALGGIGAGIAVGLGYFSSYQNAEEIYDVYKNTPQASAYARLNTGFATREDAYQEAEGLRKKALRTYMLGGGISVATLIYRALTKPVKDKSEPSSPVQVIPTGAGVSVRYTF